MSGSSSTITAMSRCAPVAYGVAPTAGSISTRRTSLATSRAARTRAGPKWRLAAAIGADQPGAGQALERSVAAEDDVEVAAREARVLAAERPGPGGPAPLDRPGHAPGLGLGQGQEPGGVGAG